jgi:uncharacterized protein (TIGR03435 family)
VLKLLVEEAYGVQGFLISGGPNWVNSERFDVIAKAGADTPDAELKRMLQRLLEANPSPRGEKCFGLHTHGDQWIQGCGAKAW